MDPNTYQRLAARTECDQRRAKDRMGARESVGGCDPLQPIRLNHAALGLAGEAGELCGAVERWLYYGRDLDKVNVKEELGDCLWYLALACNALGLELADVMAANVLKLRARYPERYTDEHARARDLDAERRALGEGRRQWGDDEQEDERCRS